jgi:3',5'-cyclic AMP phosphodiesterase CpdA
MTERPHRRRFLECMAWAGTGTLWTVSGGLAASVSLDQALAAPKPMHHGGVKPFTFLQVSDSHIGFAKPANPDARATYREAVAKIKALPRKPDFIIHTGDVSQLSKDQEFDDADQILKEAGLETFHVPGEHDLLDEGQGKAFLARYGKDALGDGWYSFDHSGVHFIALINVKELNAGGSGHLGEAQLAWLKADLAGRSASQPIVVFTHVPLWALYPQWGWGTDDAEPAMAMLRRFGSVMVLNGHIHQVQQKLEGNITFHTARSTAFPQPAPGTPGASPGPLKVAAEQLRPSLGIRTVNVVNSRQPLALIDTPLA